MCSICYSTPCHPRCPNADEEKPVYRCSECGGSIFEGDKFFQNDIKEICEECMEEMSVEEILNLFNEDLKTA